jgi:phosphate acetyltransferase
VSFLESLTTRARARRATLAFPEVSDPRTASAIARLLDEEICSVVAVGEPSGVRESLVAAGADADEVAVFDPGDRHTVESHAERQVELSDGSVSQSRATDMAEDPLTLAGLLAAQGIADGVVAGTLHPTRDVIRAALRAIGTAEGVEAVSSAFYMLVPAFRGVDDEVLTFADAGVNTEPNAEELADNGIAAAGARRLVVGDEPRVAYLSYSTLGSASGDSVDRVVRAVEVFRERLPDVHVDGELQGDAALIDSVGRRKAPGSSVAGRANVLVFPDLNSANIAYKLVQRITGGQALGPVLQGLRRPYNDLSRGATTDEIFAVSCVTALMVTRDE